MSLTELQTSFRYCKRFSAYWGLGKVDSSKKVIIDQDLISLYLELYLYFQLVRLLKGDEYFKN